MGFLYSMTLEVSENFNLSRERFVVLYMVVYLQGNNVCDVIY